MGVGGFLPRVGSYRHKGGSHFGDFSYRPRRRVDKGGELVATVAFVVRLFLVQR